MMAQVTQPAQAEQVPATAATPAAPATDDGRASTPGAGGSAKEANPPTRHRLSFGAIVPLLILLLAAAILWRIATSWDGWTGAQAVQRTNDAQVRADVTPLSTRV